MGFLALGLLMTVCAVGALTFALVASPVARIPIERRRRGDSNGESILTKGSNVLVTLVDSSLKQHNWVPFRAIELELAGLKVTPGSLVVTVASISLTLLLAGIVVTGNFFIVVLLTFLPAVVAKVVIRRKISQRRKSFANQLDETLQIIASALRSGQSFMRALDAVATEADSPTAEEFARVINENRLGRDLVVGLEQTAARMESEDFRWVAEAVSVQRDTGGDLNEVLDRVGATMRERNQVRQQVDALAAEGKYSGIILMALPPLVAAAYSVINPGYMTPLFSTTIGHIMLIISLILYVVGGLWMKKIVNVKY